MKELMNIPLVDTENWYGLNQKVKSLLLEKNLCEADDQIRLDGTGSIANQGQTYSYDLTFVASRIGNNLTVVGLIDVGAKGEDVIETLTETAVGNLADAIG